MKRNASSNLGQDFPNHSISVSEGSSDKSGKNSLGLVKVRIVTDQMSGNVEAMKTGREREKNWVKLE